MINELIDTKENIEFGILIAIAVIAVLLFAIAAINNRNRLTPLSYIIAIVLLPILAYQMSRLIGACDLSDATTTVSDLFGAVSPTLGKYVSSSSHDIGWFIFRRILWSVIFLAIGGAGIYVTMEPAARNPRRKGRSSSRRSYRNYDDEF